MSNGGLDVEPVTFSNGDGSVFLKGQVQPLTARTSVANATDPKRTIESPPTAMITAPPAVIATAYTIDRRARQPSNLADSVGK